MTTRPRQSLPDCGRAPLARALLVVLCLVAGFGCAAPPAHTSFAASPADPAIRRVVPEDAEAVRLSFAPLVRAAAPAVVCVTARRTAVQSEADTFYDDPIFRHFFGDLGRFGRGRQRLLLSGLGRQRLLLRRKFGGLLGL